MALICGRIGSEFGSEDSQCSCGSMQAGIGGLLLVAVVLTVILLPLSFRSVAYDEIAISVYEPAKSVSEPYLTTGLYFRVIPTSMYFYVRTVQTVDISRNGSDRVTCLTRDGIPVVLDVRYQTQLIPAEVYDVFFEFGEQAVLREAILIMTKDIFRGTCANHNLLAFFSNRTVVQGDMLSSIQAQTGTHITVPALQLNNVSSSSPLDFLHNFPSSPTAWLRHLHLLLTHCQIDIPDTVNQAIRSAEVAFQDIESAKRERIQALIAATTDLLVAEKHNAARVIMVGGQAQGIRKAGAEQAQTIIAEWDARLRSYAQVIQQTGMNSTMFVNGYLRARTLTGTSPDNTAVVNV